MASGIGYSGFSLPDDIDVLPVRRPVRVGSTGNLNPASIPAAIDGITLAVGDRFLLKDQADGTANGIYAFAGADQAAARSSDFLEGTVFAGIEIVITEGTTNEDTLWLLVTDDPITVGVSTLTFSKIAGGTGTGDVQGPGSSTDTGLARFSGISGKVIQNSTVTLNGDGLLGGTPLRVPLRSLTAGTHALSVTDYALLADTSGGVVTFTLPTPADAGVGRRLYFKKTTSDANAIVLDPGANTIDGSSDDVVITQPVVGLWLLCDGSSYFLM
jgi:hypothetical protein